MKGMALTLHQNLTPKQGLCYCQDRAANMLLNCKIPSGDNAKEDVHIPRIEMKTHNEQFIEWNQRQFAVSPALTMTMKKIRV